MLWVWVKLRAEIPSLRIYAELLRQPVGWIAAVALFAVSILVFRIFAEFAVNFDNLSYTLVSEGIGVGLYAAFIFPTARILLRDKVDLKPLRGVAWICVAIPERVFFWGVVFALSIVGILIAPDLMASEFGQWREVVLESLIAPFFIGLFVWKVGLVCGSTSASLLSLHNFVLHERRTLVLVYFGLMLLNLLTWAGIYLATESVGQIAMEVAIAARGALVVWLEGLLLTAIYLDYFQSKTPLKSL